MKRIKFILKASIGIFLLYAQTQLAMATHFQMLMQDGWDSKAYSYILKQDPSNPAKGTVKLVNAESEIPITLRLSIVDGKTNSQGKIYFLTSEAPAKYVAKWTTIDQTTITLEPGEAKTVSFTIKPPEKTTPGDYAGGLILEDLTPDLTKKEDENPAGFSAIVKVRYAQKILFSIPGERIGKYQFKDFNFDKKNNTINFKFSNAGNTILSASGAISISDGTKEVKNIPITGNSIFSDDNFNGSYNWTEHEKWGEYTAKIHLDVNSGNPLDDKIEKLESIDQTITIKFDNYAEIIKYIAYVISILLLLILILLAIWLKKKLYLKKCIKYTVQPQETVITIAGKFNMNWKKLVKINKINPPFELTVGQEILVRKPPEQNNVQK